MQNVIKFQAPFERLKFTKTTPDSILRRAVIIQAIIDATNISTDNKNSKIEREAKEWIFGKDEYFVRYCEEAGIEADYVIRVTKEAIKLQQSKNKSSYYNNMKAS